MALVLASVDLIAHEGRFWSNEVERTTEAATLYDKATNSFATSLKIQQELPDETTEGVQQILEGTQVRLETN